MLGVCNVLRFVVRLVGFVCRMFVSYFIVVEVDRIIFIWCYVWGSVW